MKNKHAVIILLLLTCLIHGCVSYEDFYSKNLKKGMTPVYIDTSLTSYFGVYKLDSIGSRKAIRGVKYDFSTIKVELLKNRQMRISKLPILDMPSHRHFRVHEILDTMFTYKFSNHPNDNETYISFDSKNEFERKKFWWVEFKIRIIDKNKYLIFESNEIPTALVLKKS